MNKFTKTLIISSFLASLSACTAFTEISSSTSSTSDAATPDITLNEFVNKRYVAIRQDAANGSGENLDALAHLLGESDKNAFAIKMKTNFDTIFMDIEEPSEIISRIESQVTSKKG
ncbi:MAG: DUF3015 domain-containing protein [Gammaproteobacteria bacterium]|nr:DUF3015 domain-containing protein [Gammaproteobacteria bacterium]